MNFRPLNLADFYKVGHFNMYPDNMTKLYGNFTPRSSRLAGLSSLRKWRRDAVVNFGLQGLIADLLIHTWNKNFFHEPKSVVVNDYVRRTHGAGLPISVEHIERLHDLGYLPIEIKALPEGALVDIKVPLYTITNTHPDFGWLVNYLETQLSAGLWKSITNATFAFEFKSLFVDYAKQTGSPLEFCDWQGHDFSMRGVSLYDAMQNGSAHLTSFLGTDTICALDYLEDYYSGRYTFLGGSVPATEHSVMCAGGKETEKETFLRLINKYPTGILSVVSDTWDFWKVLDEIAPSIREQIEGRSPDALGNAKLVFRPDSGDPVDIVVGTAPEFGVGRTPAELGAVETLWKHFGGTVNDAGFKVLNSKVGLIYGDSITLDRANRILSGLKAKGFASCNIVFGIGSFVYQYVTRDTFGMATKATYVELDNEGQEIFKDPITDSGTKKSARGLLRVEKENGKYVLYDQQTKEQEQQGHLTTVFKDGMMYNQTTIQEIRNRLKEHLNEKV